MKRIAIILTLIFVAHGVTRAQKFEPELQGYLEPDGTFISAEAAGGFQQTLTAKYLQVYSSAPTCSRVGQLYHNSATGKLGHCTVTGSPGTWEYMVSGTVAPVDATYITQTANSTLTNEQAMSSLATGIVKNTTTTGVQSIITPGTGVEAALAVNVGSAGAPVLFNGAGGTPSSMVGTNITGTASGLTAGAVTGFTAGAGVLTGPASAGVAETLGNNETITGIKTFSPTARSSGSAAYQTINVPADTGISTATESIGENHVTGTRTWVDGTVALQRERFWAGPTYNKTTTSATFTDVFNAYFTPPVAGTGVTFTRGHTLGVVDSTSASSSITGGLVVATTLGTTATSVGIGGGNINAGGTLTVGGHVTVEGVTSTGATGTGKFVFDTAPAITGTATNDNAAAGKIGEYTSSFIAQASAVSLTNVTAANVTSISLTAGDWDVWGNTVFLSDTTTTVTTISTTISTTSATNDYTTGEFGNINWPAGSVLGLANTTAKVGPRRMSLASTTTVYLTAYSAFGTSTMKAWGVLSARRVR